LVLHKKQHSIRRMIRTYWSKDRPERRTSGQNPQKDQEQKGNNRLPIQTLGGLGSISPRGKAQKERTLADRDRLLHQRRQSFCPQKPKKCSSTKCRLQPEGPKREADKVIAPSSTLTSNSKGHNIQTRLSGRSRRTPRVGYEKSGAVFNLEKWALALGLNEKLVRSGTSREETPSKKKPYGEKNFYNYGSGVDEIMGKTHFRNQGDSP